MDVVKQTGETFPVHECLPNDGLRAVVHFLFAAAFFRTLAGPIKPGRHFLQGCW